MSRWKRDPDVVSLHKALPLYPSVDLIEKYCSIERKKPPPLLQLSPRVSSVCQNLKMIIDTSMKIKIFLCRVTYLSSAVVARIIT